MKNSAIYFHLRFIKKEKIAKDVSAFYFSRKENDFDFLAGQYIHIYLSISDEKGRGNSRMFTIASSPLEKDYITIVTKRGKSLFKQSLFKLVSKTPVKFYGPSGGLILDDPPAGGKKPSYVFLSLGIGITPFRSIIKYINQKNLNIKIILLVSFSSEEDYLFLSELMDIAKNKSNINIIYTIKRITSRFIKKHVKNINDHLYYIVGSPNAVLNLEEAVLEMGVSNEKIFIENFEGY